MKFIKIIIALLFITTQSQAYVTLGTDNNCDYDSDSTTIQNLIDADYNEIRITNQTTYVENLYVPKSTMLTGGYANCQDAHDNTVTSKSTIDGNDIYSVITLASDNGIRNNTQLRNLKIVNGNGADYGHGGGISVLEDAPQGLALYIENSEISENKAFYGGGILIDGAYNIDITIRSSLIFNNIASIDGGGIHCKDSQLRLYEDAGVSYNKAESTLTSQGNGGGIYSDNCNVTLKTASHETVFDLRGIAHNTATGHGGGIFAGNDTVVSADFRLEPYPVNINNNIADSDFNSSGLGGGIYSSASHVYLYGSKLSQNSAASGAAMAFVENSTSEIKSRSSYCWNRSKCNEFIGNYTSSNGGKGGVLYINDSEVDFSYSQFLNNRADLGIVINAEANSSVSIVQSKIFKNGNGGDGNWADNYLYRFINSDFTSLYVTSADNHTSSTSFRFFNSPFKIFNSIFHSPNIANFAHSQGSVGELNCVVTLGDTGIQNTNNVVVGDPLFKDRSNANYHLLSGSPAIDLCDNDLEGINLPTYYIDMDGEYMGWDDPNVSNGMGTFDAGSDESYDTDVIFSNSFN